MAAKFDSEEIGSILKLLKENDVTEFKLERDTDRLYLRRGKQEVQQVVTSYAPPQGYWHPQEMPAHGAPQMLPTAALPQAAAVETPVVSNHHEIKSPMVGTFYRRPAVDAAPFVEVGDMVKKGQTLCIVEAMKLMNEITSDKSGKISAVCLDDGQMAEYGEVLFRIEPTS